MSATIHQPVCASRSCLVIALLAAACPTPTKGTSDGESQSSGATSSTSTPVSASGATSAGTSTPSSPGSSASGMGHSSSTSGHSISASACAAAPSFAVSEWTDYTLSSHVINQIIPAQSGISLHFTISLTGYPFGLKLSDAAGGTKTYSFSRCPGGTDSPLDGQNGTISVNGDAALDDCTNILGGFMRYVDTSSVVPVYYSGSNVATTKTCFLPTTTAPGSNTLASYHMNIYNPGPNDVSIQFKNLKQLD